ncbi:MAG: hypothetical protein RI883_1473 [Bacteroidota bacterium]|jgi:hypothetical protein
MNTILKNTQIMYKKIILSLVAIATISLSSFGQAPEAFKYQAVVRDAANTILNNQAVGMQIEILQGGIGGSVVYTESFAPTTNSYGLVNLEIGTGTTSDDFTVIDWANDTYFMRTSIDVTGGSSYAVMGTSQLVSVPYALHAKTAENVINDQVNDADADPTNEMNTSVVLNGTDLETTDGNGTIVTDLSSLVDDADADATNEMNTSVVLNGTDLETTDGNGTIVTDLSSLADDADADITNEIQNIEQVLIVGNDANGNNLVNTGKIGIGTATPNAESSMEIATALPVIFPSMTQAQVNAIVTPVEGMVQFNADSHKLQVYAMLTDNAEILNEIYIGNESGPFGFIVDQSFTSPIDGQVIAVELMFKDWGGGFPDIDFMGQGIYTVPSYSQFTWHTFILTSPMAVTAGIPANFMFIGPGVDQRSFATNSNYPNGNLQCCLMTPDNDVLFRVHIQPVAGSFGWQNMH